MTPTEALARIATHCDELETDAHPGRLVAQVRAVLTEVAPETGGTLDRDQARPIVEEWALGKTLPEVDVLLDRLAGCVRPATIDRDAVHSVVLWAAANVPTAKNIDTATDRIVGLVRPVAGVTLAGDERIEALEALKPVLGRLEGEAHWRAPAVRALVERLEATR